MKLIPNRLLKAPDAEIEVLRTNPIAYQLFWEEERKKISDPLTGAAYFLLNYGIHAPADGSATSPLQTWEYQPKMIKLMASLANIVCLKSRRIGFTLIVCHYLVWVAAFKSTTPGAKCIALSKNREDANEIIATCRLIIDSLPDEIRPRVGTEGQTPGEKKGRETQNFFSFPDRDGASIRSLSSTSSAARSYTATVLFLDEIAFHVDALSTWVAANPTTEGGGQVIVGSTGNGRHGNGKLLADLWDQAVKEGNMEPLFIPWHAREDRDEQWYTKKLQDMLGNQDKMNQEYPSEPEQAFAGDVEGLVISGTGLAVVEKRGADFRKLFEAGELPPPKGGSIEIGIDWGLNSAASILYPLAGYGTYQIDELVSNTDDAEQFSIKALELAKFYADQVEAKVDRAYYDAAGAQAMKSFKRVAPPDVRITAIPFGKYKKQAVEFLKTNVRRTEEGEETCFIAIDPRCKVTLSQTRDMKQKEDGTLFKGNDHSFDALIAGIAKKAVEWDRHNG